MQRGWPKVKFSSTLFTGVLNQLGIMQVHVVLLCDPLHDPVLSKYFNFNLLIMPGQVVVYTINLLITNSVPSSRTMDMLSLTVLTEISCMCGYVTGVDPGFHERRCAKHNSGSLKQRVLGCSTPESIESFIF